MSLGSGFSDTSEGVIVEVFGKKISPVTGTAES